MAEKTQEELAAEAEAQKLADDAALAALEAEEKKKADEAAMAAAAAQLAAQRAAPPSGDAIKVRAKNCRLYNPYSKQYFEPGEEVEAIEDGFVKAQVDAGLLEKV